MRKECPKCKRMGWIELTEDEQSIVHTCLCGYYEFLYTVYKNTGIKKFEVHEKSAKPKEGTLMRICMDAVVSVWPSRITSNEVFNIVRELAVVGKSDVTTRLSILESSGLILKVVDGKGKSGGSIWVVSEYGEQVYNLGATKCH